MNSKRSKILRRIGVAIAFCILSYLNLQNWNAVKTRQRSLEIANQNRQQQIATIRELESLRIRQRRAANDYQDIQNELRSLLRVCRSADDIFPIFDGEFIVCGKRSRLGQLQFLLSVPDQGDHEIQVTVTMRIRGAEERRLYNETHLLEPGNSYNVEFFLEPTDRREVATKRTSSRINDQVFEIENPPFFPTGWRRRDTWARTPFRLPNQYFRSSLHKPQNLLADVSFFRSVGGPESEARDSVNIQVFLVSAGPPRASLDDSDIVEQLSTRYFLQPNLKTTYHPNGYYEIK